MADENNDSNHYPAVRESYTLPSAEQERLAKIQAKFSNIKPVIKKSEIVRIGIYKVDQLEEKEAKKILEDELGRLPVGKLKKDKIAETLHKYELIINERQWRAVKGLFLEQEKSKGRPPAEIRSILNSILYIFRNEVQRRKVPQNYSSYATVRRRLKEWKKSKLWKNICAALINNVDKNDRADLQGILLRTWLIETERKIL